MKRIFLRLKQPLRNERGEITFFACFFVVGIVMLISFLLLYASIQEIWRHTPHPAAGDFLPEWKPCHTNGDMGKRRPGTLGDSHRQPARPTAKRPCLYRHQCRFGISHLAHTTWSGYPNRSHHAEWVLHLSRISFSCQPAAGAGPGRVCRLPEKL